MLFLSGARIHSLLTLLPIQESGLGLTQVPMCIIRYFLMPQELRKWGGPGITVPCNEAAVPVFNLWSHTLATFSLPALAGFEPSAAGISLRAGLSGTNQISIYSPLVSLVRDNVTCACNFSGHYAPQLSPGSVIVVSVHLLPKDALACTGVYVNDIPVHLSLDPSGIATFNATTTVQSSNAIAPSAFIWRLTSE